MWCGQCGAKMTHTTTTRDHKGVYHCGGKNWETYNSCRNARIYGPLVEARITERFLGRCAFTILTESGVRAGSPRAVWCEASLSEKKSLLGLVIERIVVTPLDVEIPLSQYRTVLRHDLDIQWKGEIASSEDVVVLADPPRPTQPRLVSAGRHQRLRARDYEELQEESTPPAQGPAASVLPARCRRGGLSQLRRGPPARA